MNPYKEYRRTGLSEMRPFVPGENLAGVSVSPEDTPELGGMIARNPNNHDDMWYVAKQYFEDNLELVSPSIVAMTFGQAIEAARLGLKIARAGWNGKNMFVVYQKGYPDGIPANKNTAEAFGIPEGSLFKCRPYLQMMCADGSCQMWLASQSDILEDDWSIVE